ncbi:hypothetical protein OH77DRAFT_1498495 [Trametes cingulata]|nr:hypothetical protein OH77DRAFT_1498495 [Trametes cingulata]
MDTTSHVAQGGTRTVIHLPYDVLLDVFSLLPSRDLVNLLCSCRTLYALVADESTWCSLSRQYGLRDVTHFGGRSWYTIYTRLLHTYGPMLGLWAGDHPYTGGVIEITLDAGIADRPGGIVVEMWRFRTLQPEDLDGPEVPELPAYSLLARIDFSTTATLHEPAKMTCRCDKRSSAHRAWFELLSPSFRGFYLHTRRGQYAHPDLPGPEVDAWPHAIIMSCELGCIQRHRPFLGFEDISQAAPRFYPLRHEPHPYIDADSPSWGPTSLEGVWLGSHGPHGTECLFFEWVGRLSTLRAWKISGDENVPRGALTWEAKMHTSLQLSGDHLEVCARSLGDLNGYKFFRGSGTFSARGFMPHQRESAAVILAVGHAPMLRVVWVDVEEVSGYIRYPGRQY